MIKMIINAITQIREKTTNATQDQIEFERGSKASRTLKVKAETE